MSKRVVRTWLFALLSGTMFLTQLSVAQAIADEADGGRSLYAILAIDTKGDNAQQLGMAIDGARVQKWLRDSCDALDGRVQLKLTILADSDCTPERIFRALSAIQPTFRDTVVVYYTGHGVTSPRGYRNRTYFDHVLGKQVLIPDIDAGTSGHFLALDAGLVSRVGLIEALSGVRCRLALLITDCCAGFPKDSQAGTRSDSNEEITEVLENVTESVPQVNPEVFADLFLNRAGLLNINARVPGENAGGDRAHGGHLTYALLSAMSGEPVNNTPQDGLSANWAAVLSKTEQILQREFPDATQATGSDLKFIFRDGWAEALGPDAFIDDRHGVMINGLYLKVTARGEVSNRPAAGLYRLDSPIVIDGTRFSVRADGTWPNGFGEAWRSAKESITCVALQVPVSNDRRRHDVVKIRFANENNPNAASIEQVTEVRFRFTIRRADGTVVEKELRGGDFQTVRDALNAAYPGSTVVKAQQIDP